MPVKTNRRLPGLALLMLLWMPFAGRTASAQEQPSPQPQAQTAPDPGRTLNQYVRAGGLAFRPADTTVRKQTFLYSVKGTDSLYLDRYWVASQRTGNPCLIFVFGGGFMTGERNEPRYIPYFHFLAQQGYDVVSIDYRLGLKGVDPAQASNPTMMVLLFWRAVSMAVEDLYDATAYVVSRAEDWAIDPAAIVANGSSAGAITVLQGEYGLCNRQPQSARLPEGFRYAGLISFAGAVLEPEGPLKWAQAPAPIQFFHGNADSNVPYDKLVQQNMGFYGPASIAPSLDSLPSPYYFYTVDNAAHEIAIQPMDANRAEILIFLDRMVFGGQKLMLDSRVSRIGAPILNKNFTLMDYVRKNFGL